ncbi:MAG: ATP-binding domain-containing protein [Promethearchaeota archaeon]
MDRIVGRVHEKSTPGEKRLHRYFNLLLRTNQNSGDFRCYYDQVLRTEHRPDFTLITKKYGIVVVEVKDYSMDSLLFAYPDDQWVIKNVGMVQNPYQQLHKYKIQCQSIIDIKGYKDLHIPIHQILAFPNLSKLSPLAEEILRRPQKHIIVLFKEDLSTYKLFHEHLRKIFHEVSKLTFHQMDHLTAGFFPTYKLPTYSQANIFDIHPEMEKIKLLDDKQNSYAHSLNSGHRLVFGCAGSGKTVILIARARYIAQNNPNGKILVLCYNRLLSQMIKNLIIPNKFKAHIEVKTFHLWAKHMIFNIDSRFQSLYELKMRESESIALNNGLNTFFTEEVPNILHQAIEYQKNVKKNPSSIMYDAILIDEAQDFDESWFKVALETLKGGDDGSLFVACDGMQGIYARKRFSWSSVGIRARGRRSTFTKSYRNSRNVGLCAQSIITNEMRSLANTEDEFTLPEKYNGLLGEISIIHRDTREKEYHAICKILKKSQLSSVLVIYRKNLWKIPDHPFMKALENAGIKDRVQKTWTSNSDGIVLTTLHSAKGLEADMVIIPELDTYSYKTDDRQLLYVGMTRTINKLILTTISKTGLVEKIQEISQNLTWSAL